MKKHSKESLQIIRNEVQTNTYYLPKTLFDRQSFGNVRLEIKMAYVAILDTVLKKTIFNKQGEALVKLDNPEIINTLEILTNKKVDQEKMQGYFKELLDARFISIDKQDVYVMDIG